MKGRNEKLKDILLFLTKLTFLSVVLYAIGWWVDLSLIQEQLSVLVSRALEFLGLPVQRAGTTLFLGDLSFYITRDCTGWKGLVFFTALVISVRSGWGEKLRAVAVNLPVIFSINLLRVLILMLVTYSLGGWGYTLFHDILWQFSMIAVVVVLWASWGRRAKLII